MAKKYLTFRKGRESFQKNEDTMKKALMEDLASQGEVDDKGHRYFYFPEEVDGVFGLKRERRVSQILNEDAAMDLIERYGLQEVCIEHVPVLNEDALLAEAYKGTISDAEMQSLYETKESFAFILVKESS